MSAYQDFAKANDEYVATFGDKGNLPLPPSKKLLIGEWYIRTTTACRGTWAWSAVLTIH